MDEVLSRRRVRVAASHLLLRYRFAPKIYPVGWSLQTSRLDENTGLDDPDRVVGLKAPSALVYATRLGIACRLASAQCARA